jgi:translation initiation factor IF-1
LPRGHTVEGVVEKTLPKLLYEVRCDDGRTVKASWGGVAKQVTVKISRGDRVVVEVSPIDPTRGKIKEKK